MTRRPAATSPGPARARPTRRAALGLLAGAAALPGTALGDGAPAPLRVAALRFGTVNWELETIRRLGLDRENGIALEVLPQASGSASQIAFMGGEADAMVGDWLWVARQRAAGRDIVFLPYSRAVGGLLVPPGSAARGLGDLEGAEIGIAGGPLDKSWLVLRAHARQQGVDLAASTTQAFAAPPLLQRQALAGAFGGVITYWHYMAKLEVQGFRRLVDVNDAAAALGLGRELPLLGYIFRGEFVRENRAVVEGFARASRAAKAALETDGPWEALRPQMDVASAAEFEALKAGFRAGRPSGGIDRASAEAMFALMADLGGEALVGEATELPDGVFLEL